MEFKKGDVVYIEGVVIEVYNKDEKTYPVTAHFENLGCEFEFTNNGKYLKDDLKPALLLKRRSNKKEVVRWQWLLKYRKNDQTFDLTTDFYTEEELKLSFPNVKIYKKVEESERVFKK
jgi:hypothetical protein